MSPLGCGRCCTGLGADVPRTRRAVLLTGNVLCNNPRVIKEADALSDAGWDVEVLGAWLSDAFVARDTALMATRSWRFTPVLEPGNALLARVRTRLATEVWHRLQLGGAWQLGYVGPELLAAARRRTADLFVAHSEQALWVAARLAREGRRIGVDMEDWFSSDSDDADRGRPLSLLQQLEREVLNAAAYRACPSQSMSTALAAAYSCPPPTVVYNAFPWSERNTLDGQRHDRTDRPRASIHWYSQTIGPGRGLETLGAALQHVEHDAEIHLRGALSADYQARLLGAMPERWRDRVFFHEPVTNAALLSRIAEHDIGFSGEVSDLPNKNLTIGNKVLHYLVAGLAVVASDTAGTREAAALAPGGILSFDGQRPRHLADVLNGLLATPARLDAARANALDAARRVLSWEHQRPTLLAAFETALERPVVR